MAWLFNQGVDIGFDPAQLLTRLTNPPLPAPTPPDVRVEALWFCFQPDHAPVFDHNPESCGRPAGIRRVVTKRQSGLETDATERFQLPNSRPAFTLKTKCQAASQLADPPGVVP